MNLFNNPKLSYFTYIALMTCLLAILVKFNGTVTVQVTPLSLKVQVNNHPTGCPIHQQLPETQPHLLIQEIASSR
jgi:hypothetical protein